MSEQDYKDKLFQVIEQNAKRPSVQIDQNITDKVDRKPYEPQMTPPDWREVLAWDNWTVDQVVAFSLGADLVMVYGVGPASNHDDIDTIHCFDGMSDKYDQRMTRLMMSNLTGSDMVKTELLDRSQAIDWLSRQGWKLPVELERYIKFLSRVDTVVGGKGQVRDKRAAIAALYTSYAEIKIIGNEIIGNEIQMTVKDFKKAINRDIPASHLDGLFGISSRQIQRDVSEARNNPYTFKHGNRSD